MRGGGTRMLTVRRKYWWALKTATVVNNRCDDDKRLVTWGIFCNALWRNDPPDWSAAATGSQPSPATSALLLLLLLLLMMMMMTRMTTHSWILLPWRWKCWLQHACADASWVTSSTWLSPYFASILHFHVISTPDAVLGLIHSRTVMAFL